MTLSPTLNSGIAYEQPVQQPNVFNAVGNLVDAFSPPKREGPSAAEKNREFEVGLKNNLVRDLERAQALREQGDERGALNIERKAKLTYSVNGGDLNSGDTQSLISTYTGQEAEDVGFSQDEQAFNTMLESPEFESNYLGTYATHPDISEEERVQLAASRLQRTEANEALIEQTRNDWNTGQGQSSRMAKIDDWRTNNVGLLTLSGQNGGKITNDMVQRAQLSFSNLESEITAKRPSGISNEEWAPIQNSLASVKAQLELANSLTANTEVESDLLTAGINAVQALPDASAVEKNIMIQMLKRPEEFLAKGIIPVGRIQELAKQVNDMSTEDNADSITKGAGDGDIIGDDGPSSFTTTELNSVNKRKPEENFNRAAAAAEVAGGVSNVLNDPKSLSDWIGLTRNGLAGLYSMASENEAWATAEGYRKFFTPNFFETMEGLRKNGSDYTYTAMRNKATDAIDANLTALQAGINVRTRGDMVTYDRASNSLVFNRDTFMRDQNLPPHIKKEMLAKLDGKYGGDVMAFITNEPNHITSRIFGELQDSDVTDRIKAINQLNSFKRKLPEIEVEPTEGGAGDDNLEGSAGNDRLQEAGNLQDLQLVSLIDRTEGGGDYDTLFGFSQKEGKAFAGINVSDMTLEELNRFSRGEYANWSKEQLGYVATPMGKYQIVGTTLRQTAKEMGLPSNTVFTESVQDAMFHHLAKKSLAGKKSASAKRAAMRGTWEGFKHVSDKELDAAIAEFEGTPAPTLADLQSREANMSTTPTMSPRPMEAPESLGNVSSILADAAQSNDGGAQSVSAQLQSASQEGSEGPQATEGAEGEGVAPEVASREWETLSDQTKGMLERVFGSKEAFIEALISGEVNKEDV